ncbi:hypothetical protein [Pseudomonas serbica]|uniref:hypothetical protein n=1 Tax=Pseudomonas serbica TaxID=2965074 RepID=UPI00237A548B|nr:hypothetical protein [Pseudomonas serbica]
MHKVEPFRIETTRERLTAALALANTSLLSKPDVASKAVIERQSIDIILHADELKAIYYTLRLRGIQEAEFAQHIGELTVDDILVAVENSPTNEDDVIVYTIADVEADLPPA